MEVRAKAVPSVRFSFSDVFDEDYLHFYDTILTTALTERDVAAISALVGPGFRGTILDFGCGHGRIANRLGSQGWHVTGLDASDVFINRARADASNLGVQVRYILGDITGMEVGDQYDVVINWSTSLGYFSERDDRLILNKLREALSPAGMLLLETINRDYLLRNFPATTVTERDGSFMIDMNAYEPITGCLETERIILKANTARRMNIKIRLFTFPEIASWLRDAGFREIQGYDEECNPYSLGSRRMIVVAKK